MTAGKLTSDKTLFTRKSAKAIPRLNSALPQLAPNPPTISYNAANAGTTLTNAKEWPLTGGAVLLSGAQAFASQGTDAAGNGYMAGSNQTGNEYPNWFFAFNTDAPTFELTYQGNLSPNYRMLVDGYAVTLDTVMAAGATDGQNHRMLVQFPDRRLREIVIDSDTFFCAGVVTTAIDTVFATNSRRKMGFMGDSYLQNGGINGIAPVAAKINGCDFVLNGSGGTGYLNDQGGSGGHQTFIARLPGLLAAGLDYLVTCGGINDGPDLYTPVANYLALAKKTLTPDRIFVTGPWDPPSQTHSTNAAKRDVIKAATLAAGCVFIDNIAGAWQTGTGNVASPAGDGNADVYIPGAGETTHPNPAGYQYLGARLGLAIAPYIGL